LFDKVAVEKPIHSGVKTAFQRVICVISYHKRHENSPVVIEKETSKMKLFVSLESIFKSLLW